MVSELKQTNPLISIVIPVYNAKDTILRTLDLLRMQTYKAIEIICIDDGSTDTTPELLHNEAQKDSRIRIIQTANQGAYKARRLGIRHARGDYIGFCDADDEPLPDMFEKLLRRATETAADIVVSAYYRCSDGEVMSTEMQWRGGNARNVTPNSGWVTSINPAFWNKLFKASVARQGIALDNPPRITEDALFFLSVIPLAGKIAFLSEPVYKYNYPEDSSTNHLDATELTSILENWRIARECVLGRSPDFSLIFDWSAFIHIAISSQLSMIKGG